jgi:hypothetical protein
MSVFLLTTACIAGVIEDFIGDEKTSLLTISCGHAADNSRRATFSNGGNCVYQSEDRSTLIIIGAIEVLSQIIVPA